MARESLTRVTFAFVFVVGTASVVNATTVSGGTGQAAGGFIQAADVEIVRSEFGLFYPMAGDGQPAFVPTMSVPLLKGQAYGWVVEIKTKAKVVRWREDFTLPSSPATWGAPEPFGSRATSDDGRSTITEREVHPKNGVLFNYWAVAPGDPKGIYRMRISIEGREIRTFEFEVK